MKAKKIKTPCNRCQENENDICLYFERPVRERNKKVDCGWFHEKRYSVKV